MLHKYGDRTGLCRTTPQELSFQRTTPNLRRARRLIFPPQRVTITSVSLRRRRWSAAPTGSIRLEGIGNTRPAISSAVSTSGPVFLLIGRRSCSASGTKALQAMLPVTRIVLFGSYARGRHTIASDIDLLVTYSGPKRDDACGLVWRRSKLSFAGGSAGWLPTAFRSPGRIRWMPIVEQGRPSLRSGL